jgi:inorganic pyrophosphatase
MTMSDEQGPDDKVIAVHVDDPEYAHYRDVFELSEHRLQELQRFFLDYKVLENKRVTVEDLRGRAAAERAIRDAARRYREQVRPTMTRPPEGHHRPGAAGPAGAPSGPCTLPGAAALRAGPERVGRPVVPRGVLAVRGGGGLPGGRLR